MIDLERVKHILVYIDEDGKLVIGEDDDIKQQSFEPLFGERYKLEVWIVRMADGTIKVDSGMLRDGEEK